LRAIFKHEAFQALALGAAALIVYLAGLRYEPAGDSVPAELLPIAILRQGSLCLNAFSDPQAAQPFYFAVHDGRVISFYPIVPGVLNVPAHLVAAALGSDLYANRYLLAKITAAVTAAFSVVFMFLALTRICGRRRDAAILTVAYAFATCAWSVAAQTLWQHGPSLLFLSVAFALLLRPESRWMPYCGFFLGLAVFNRPANLAFAAPVTVYMLLHQRNRLVPFLLSAAVPALLMAWYSQEYWGSVFALGQGHRFDATHGSHLTHFHNSLWVGLSGLLFSPNRGLFVFSPVFLLALPSAFLLFRGGGAAPVCRYLAAGAVLCVLLHAKWSVWWGGWSFGYRLITEVTPVMILLLALAWERWYRPRRLMQMAFWALLGCSVYAHYLGAYYFPSNWNSSPRSIDDDRSRIWDVHDTELGRCQAVFLENWSAGARP